MYNVGDELLLDGVWHVVSAVYLSAMVLYSIDEQIRVTANLDYASKYEINKRAPKKRNNYLYDKGKKIYTTTHLITGQRVFYWCAVNGEPELRPAIFVGGRPKDVYLRDEEAEKYVNLKHVRWIVSYGES